MPLPQVGGSKHSQSPVLPSTPNGDGASMRRRDLKRELIRAPAEIARERQPPAAHDASPAAEAVAQHK
jgi:hypothetical protein